VVKTPSTHSSRGGITKADLADAVYQRHGGLTRAEAAAIVDTILRTVKTTLAGGRSVKIKNFGSFEVRQRRRRRGVDPSSGEPILIPDHQGLSFRPARYLRDALGTAASVPIVKATVKATVKPVMSKATPAKAAPTKPVPSKPPAKPSVRPHAKTEGKTNGRSTR
jgi:integration host factor subunit alpha